MAMSPIEQKLWEGIGSEGAWKIFDSLEPKVIDSRGIGIYDELRTDLIILFFQGSISSNLLAESLGTFSS